MAGSARYRLARSALVSPRVLAYAYAVAVAEAHGVGKRELSNFDCFHYAYAKAAGEPLLTLDRRLRATDVETRP